LALKVYRLHRTPHKKKSAIGYSLDRVGQVAADEFTILEKAYRAGVPVPTPARRVDNMFTMRFLGDETNARQLKDSELDDPDNVMNQALGIIEQLLLNACLIHGDLSEYNLLLYREKLFVIDFPQAIDLSSRVDRPGRFEKSKPFLLRDIRNVADYFSKYDITFDIQEMYDRLVSRFETEQL
jgi:RIO kinase 1